MKTQINARFKQTFKKVLQDAWENLPAPLAVRSSARRYYTRFKPFTTSNLEFYLWIVLSILLIGVAGFLQAPSLTFKFTFDIFVIAATCSQLPLFIFLLRMCIIEKELDRLRGIENPVDPIRKFGIWLEEMFGSHQVKH